MTLLEITGFVGAALIGVALGLIGGGGSILTVPVMVYLMGVNPVLSTAYSLFVVGVSALVGAIQNMRKGLVCYNTALHFAIPSFISVYLTRRYLLPAIPEILFTWGNFTLSKSMAVMVFFGIIMLIAALSMIRPQLEGARKEDRPLRFRQPLIILEGVAVGLLTGIVGAGGGFLIIPALVLLARLPMKLEVAQLATQPEKFSIIDIRNKSEYAGEKFFENSINIPLPELRERVVEINTTQPIVVHCVGGYRSAIGASIVQKNLNGTTKVYNLGKDVEKFKK